MQMFNLNLSPADELMDQWPHLGKAERVLRFETSPRPLLDRQRPGKDRSILPRPTCISFSSCL